MRPDAETPGEPAHDATGIVWWSILGLLLWPLILVLGLAAAAVFA